MKPVLIRKFLRSFEHGAKPSIGVQLPLTVKNCLTQKPKVETRTEREIVGLNICRFLFV